MNKKDKIDKFKKGVDKIDINIYTNIGDGKKEAIPFSRSLFSEQPTQTNRVLLENTPFFTTNYSIPYGSLKKKPREEIFNILFNKDKFTSFLNKHSTAIDVPDSKTIDQNVKALLNALFPTYYPVKGNYTDTYSELIEGKSPAVNLFSLSLPSFGIPSIFKSFTNTPSSPSPPPPPPPEEEFPDFTYLTIDGKIYTVLKIVYLNDFINNPKYSKVIDSYVEYKGLKNTADQKIEWEEYKTKKEITSKMIELKIHMNLPINRCNYESSIVSHYDYNFTINSSRYSTDRYNSSNIKNTTLRKLDDEFNKKLFFEKNNLFEKASINYNPITCYNIYNIQTNDQLSTYTEGYIRKNRSNIQKLNKLINDIDGLKEDSKKLEDTEKSVNTAKIYSKIIRGKVFDDESKTFYDSYKTNIDAEYAKYNDFIREIDIIFKDDSSNRFSLPSVFSEKYSSISKLYSKLKTYIDIKNDKSTEEVKEYITKEYPKLLDFKELIKKFTYPNRESFNEQFADMLIYYTQATKSKEKDRDMSDENKFPMFLQNIIDGDFTSDINKLYTGLDLYYTPVSGKSKYEIQVYMDLVEGKITKNVLTQTDCFFKDNGLVNLFYKLKDTDIFTNKYVFNSKMPVVKIPEITQLPPTKTGGTRKYKLRRRLYRKVSRRRRRR